MVQQKALLLGRIDHAQKSWEALSSLAELMQTTVTNRKEFLGELRSGKFDGVVVICDRAPAAMEVTENFDKELIDALPKSLRFLCHNGAGYDSIDVAACTARGILVSNCPGVVEEATADCAIFLILATLRSFNNGILAIRNGTWSGLVPPEPLGRDPQGKVLGILGMGGIGKNLKRKAECFGMKVIYHNRTQLSSDQSDGAEFVSFDDLLSNSDVLSLNLPLNAKTRHIISTKEFEKMKHGICIVNTARGGVLDEAALVQAISSGQVWSAGLDVYESEPNIHPGLVSNPRVCLLPHMGTSTVETKTRMEEWNIGNCRAALERGKMTNVVAEQMHLV